MRPWLSPGLPFSDYDKESQTGSSSWDQIFGCLIGSLPGQIGLPYVAMLSVCCAPGRYDLGKRQASENGGVELLLWSQGVNAVEGATFVVEVAGCDAGIC